MLTFNIDTVGITVALIAVGVSLYALWNSKKVQQYNSVDKVLSDVNLVDKTVADLYKLYSDTKNVGILGDCLDLTLNQLFNRLDWISFLINKKQIKDRSLLKYLYPVIIDHYEKTFLPAATKAMKQPSEFKDLKALYEKIKDDKKILKLI